MRDDNDLTWDEEKGRRGGEEENERKGLLYIRQSGNYSSVIFFLPTSFLCLHAASSESGRSIWYLLHQRQTATDKVPICSPANFYFYFSIYFTKLHIINWPAKPIFPAPVKLLLHE